MRRQGRKGCIKPNSPFLSFPIFLADLRCLHYSLLCYSVHLSFFIVSSFSLSVSQFQWGLLGFHSVCLGCPLFFIASKTGITAFFSSNICWFLQLSGLFLAWLNDLNLNSSHWRKSTRILPVWAGHMFSCFFIFSWTQLFFVFQIAPLQGCLEHLLNHLG